MMRASPFRADSLAAQLYALKTGAECWRTDARKNRRACVRAIADIRAREPLRDYDIAPCHVTFDRARWPTRRMLCVTRIA